MNNKTLFALVEWLVYLVTSVTVIYSLWNWVGVKIGLVPIDYLQAIGLFVLSNVLFKDTYGLNQVVKVIKSNKL